MPDIPEPTSPALTKDLYISSIDIIESVFTLLNKKLNLNKANLKKLLNYPKHHDIPGENFEGPF